MVFDPFSLLPVVTSHAISGTSMAQILQENPEDERVDESCWHPSAELKLPLGIRLQVYTLANDKASVFQTQWLATDVWLACREQQSGIVSKQDLQDARTSSIHLIVKCSYRLFMFFF